MYGSLVLWCSWGLSSKSVSSEKKALSPFRPFSRCCRNQRRPRSIHAPVSPQPGCHGHLQEAAQSSAWENVNGPIAPTWYLAEYEYVVVVVVVLVDAPWCGPFFTKYFRAEETNGYHGLSCHDDRRVELVGGVVPQEKSWLLLSVQNQSLPAKHSQYLVVPDFRRSN
jgi:hypothetical protein